MAERTGNVSKANRQIAILWHITMFISDFKVATQFADGDYLKTFNIGLIAGWAADTGRHEILVNETLVHKLGLRSPEHILGKTIAIGMGDSRV